MLKWHSLTIRSVEIALSRCNDLTTRVNELNNIVQLLASRQDVEDVTQWQRQQTNSFFDLPLGPPSKNIPVLIELMSDTDDTHCFDRM